MKSDSCNQDMLFAGVTNLNHMMDTVTKNFLTFEKIKTSDNIYIIVDLFCKNGLLRAILHQM
jgi:hypothetical protein